MSRTKLIMSILLLAVGFAAGIGSARLSGDNASAGTSGESHQLHDHGTSEASGQLDWCAEHRVPESECTLCNPELVEFFKSSGDWCAEHGLPESHCRECNPRLVFAQEPADEPVTAEPVQVSVFFPPNELGCTNDQAVIRFASEATADRIGLKIEPVRRAVHSGTIEAPAEVVFDETRTTVVTTSYSAVVLRWLVEPGQTVSAGQALAELESPEIAQIKAEYLEALSDMNVEDRRVKRTKELRERNLVSAAEFEDAEAELNASMSRTDGATGKLRAAGLSEDDIESVEKGRQVDARWLLRSGQRAAFLERWAKPGEMLQAGTPLALTGDPHALWIEASVQERDMHKFQLGQELEFSADGESLSKATGNVIWVSQLIDPETRTGVVRAKVRSGADNLRAHSYGRIGAVSTSSHAALSVARDAVQWEGCCHVVFVQEAPDRYRPHKVSVERGDSQHYIVAGDLSAGDLVVTTGSFFLKSELLKESLGTGCAGE